MKKIVAAAAAGLMLAGAAFADVSFSYTGSAILGGRNHAYDDKKADNQPAVEKGKSSLKQMEEIYRNDCLSLSMSNDVAGVVCDWDIHSTSEDTAINKDQTKDGVVRVYNHEGTAMELDSFYAWMDFALPVGSLEITSGKWNSRFCNRVNKYAGDLDGAFYELYKPGIVLGGDQEVDGSNLTDGKYSTILAYTLGDVLPGKLMLKAGMVSNSYYTPKDSKDTVMKSSFCYEVAYEQADLIKANLAIKNTHIDTTSYGLYVSPLMVKGLDSMVGFTYLMDGDDTAFGIDARATYDITEKTSVTGMFNFSQYDVDGADDSENAMWYMASVGYKAGDNIRYVFTASDEVSDFNAKIGTANVFALSPACEVQASEKCNVTVGFDMRWTNVKPFSGTADVAVPIYVSFSL